MSTKVIKKSADVVIFHWPHNRPFKRDGDEFKSMARYAAEYYRAHGMEVRNYAIPKRPKLEKRQFILGTLQVFKKHSLSRVIFFCHGSPRAFAGFNMRNAGRLGGLIYKKTKRDAAVLLYCCLTGKKANGIANMLAMSSARRVIAHKTRGHTTRNPYKRLFNGGQMVDLWPQDKKARKLWIGKLQKSRGYFIYEMVEEFLNG